MPNSVSTEQREIGIVGYGNQAKAWASNLRDSGWKVSVFLREGSSSSNLVRSENFPIQPLGPALSQVPIVALLIPDDAMPAFSHSFGRHFCSGQTIVLAHGYCLHFQTVSFSDDVDQILVAPKGIASAVRGQFLQGAGVPGVVSIHRDFTKKAHETAQMICDGLGLTRAGIYYASVKDEVEADLFSEQVLQTGGLPALVLAAYQTLVKNGIQPEVAYLECVHELAYMTHLFQEKGLYKTLALASPTARFGGTLGGQRLISEVFQTKLQRIFDDIRSGRFTQALDLERESDFPKTESAMQDLKKSAVEEVGSMIRTKLQEGKA